MKAAFPLLALVLAVPAFAQDFVSSDHADGIAAAAKSARTLRDKLTPAPVDPRPVKALTDRLIKDGEQVEMEQGIGNIYTRVGRPDANGRFKSLQANLVEIPAELTETPDDSMFRQVVMRRYFSHLEATSESWEVDPKTGKGKVRVWIYKVSLDGRLMSVEHQIAPVEPGEDGQAAPVEAKARSYRLSPSDPSVQRRWKAMTKELLTLGRVVEA
ncbi:MAG: hypothetical protein HYV14_13640 [Elusimicrobia bacterium]|nr:hypothetical protein [Elusimicrobiota bacterium]